MVCPRQPFETRLTAEIERFPDRPIPGVDLEGKSAEEREPLCLEYCRSMPGAVQLHLEAGDFALYRNTLWHLGNYVPYRKRATLHDSAWTPELRRGTRKREPNRANGAKLASVWRIQISTPPTKMVSTLVYSEFKK